MGTVAQAIRRIIAEKALVQRGVAERAGFTVQQFSYMLCGRKLILADYIPNIAAALGVNYEELFADHAESR